MKTIAYLIASNGIDGRDKTKIVGAFFDEKQRDAALAKNVNSAYLSAVEIIVDIERKKKDALAKLDAIDKLILGIN